MVTRRAAGRTYHSPRCGGFSKGTETADGVLISEFWVVSSVSEKTRHWPASAYAKEQTFQCPLQSLPRSRSNSTAIEITRLASNIRSGEPFGLFVCPRGG